VLAQQREHPIGEEDGGMARVLNDLQVDRRRA
jgi:hypothetical protein